MMAADNGHPGDTRPTPDPTVMSTEAIDRASEAAKELFEAKREVLEERLNGIDRATKVLADDQSKTELKTPEDIRRAVGHLKDLMDVELRVMQVEFRLVEQGFKLRDDASKAAQAAADTAIQAAFKAQQEINAVQNKATEVAATKTETTFAVLLTKVDEKVDDLRTRVTSTESSRTGASGLASSQRQNVMVLVAMVSLVLALIAALVTR